MADGNQEGEPSEARECNCKICKLEDSIGNGWGDHLSEELQTDKFKNLKQFLCKQKGNFYPKAEQIFDFTQYTKLEDIKIVIIGQNPYHQKGRAMGLCFSVPSGEEIPRSLQNIFKELATDIPGFQTPTSGDLTKWAKQGVLLLNDVLTVAPGIKRSHSGLGWKEITNKIVEKISLYGKNVVFMLWGNEAQTKSNIIDSTKHKILQCSHPSPLSAHRTFTPFIGCKHFSKANKYLEDNKREKIYWNL